MQLRKIAPVATLTLLYVSIPAQAHFRLVGPKDWLVTNTTGDPDGGPQKTNPCGEGEASNVVTRVKAGSKVTISWADTIAHPGHYRISFAQDRSQLVEPIPVVNANNCESAPVENSPTLPVLIDGINKHDPTMNTQEITIPNTPCDR